MRTNWDRWRFGVGLEDQCCDLLTDDFYHSFELSEAGQNITFEIGGDMVWADFGVRWPGFSSIFRDMLLTHGEQGYKSTHPFRNQAPEFPDDGSTLLNSFFILNVRNCPLLARSDEKLTSTYDKVCNNFNTNVKVEVALTTQDNFVQHQKTSRLKPDTSTCSAQGTAGHFFFESNSTKTFTETWTIRARIEGRYSKVAKNVALRIPPEAPDTGSVLLVVDEEGWAIWAAKKLGKGKWDAQGSEAEEEGEEALVYQEDL